MSKGNVRLLGFTDAAHACEIDKKSRSGGIELLANGPVSSTSTKQKLKVAISTNESETYAFSDEIRRSLGLFNLLKAVPVSERNPSLANLTSKPPLLCVDNKASFEGGLKNIFTKRQRHIDIRYAHINHEIQSGNIESVRVPSGDNLANPKTKPMGRLSFIKHQETLENGTFFKPPGLY